MHVEPRLREPTLVLAFGGWNDAGDSASTALKFVDVAIHSVPLAEIDADEFFDFTVRRPEVVLRPVAKRPRSLGGEEASVARERTVVWPHTEFRYGSIDESRELITGIGPEPHLRWRRYCDAVIELCQRLGVARAVLLGAYQADVVYSQPLPITGFATREDELGGLGVVNSDYQGPTGIIGVLGARLEDEGIPVVSLWAGLPHYINATPNPRAALALLRKLSQCLDLQVDPQPLKTSAAEFEEKINKLVASDPELSDYVRELKKREFAS
jgi:proteasome assembly chaperone (PAC2) family protein